MLMQPLAPPLTHGGWDVMQTDYLPYLWWLCYRTVSNENKKNKPVLSELSSTFLTIWIITARGCAAFHTVQTTPPYSRCLRRYSETHFIWHDKRNTVVGKVSMYERLLWSTWFQTTCKHLHECKTSNWLSSSMEIQHFNESRYVHSHYFWRAACQTVWQFIEKALADMILLSSDSPVPHMPQWRRRTGA